jgi:peptidoglycan hydrolase FlgJ
MAGIPARAGQTGIPFGALAARAATSLPQKKMRLDDDVGAPTAGGKPALDPKAKARSQAADFEAMVLSTMFNQMFTSIDGEGPFGGSGGAGVWRSFLSDEYAKSFTKAGGIGIADHVYRSLIRQQELRSAA